MVAVPKLHFLRVYEEIQNVYYLLQGRQLHIQLMNNANTCKHIN